jgi:hypothetical protein
VARMILHAHSFGRNETAEAMTTSPLRAHSGRARARKASVTPSGGGRRLGSSPGKARARSRVRTIPGSSGLAPHPGLADLAGMDLDEHVEVGLADRIGGPSRGRCRARP